MELAVVSLLGVYALVGSTMTTLEVVLVASVVCEDVVVDAAASEELVVDAATVVDELALLTLPVAVEVVVTVGIVVVSFTVTVTVVVHESSEMVLYSSTTSVPTCVLVCIDVRRKQCNPGVRNLQLS